MRDRIPLETQISNLLHNAVHVNRDHPALAMRFARIYRQQVSATRRRRAWAETGIDVPTLLLAEIAPGRTLDCRRCHTWTSRRGAPIELVGGALRDTIARAHDLGIAFLALAPQPGVALGDLLDITARHRDTCFPLILNAPLVDSALTHRLRDQHHVLPMIPCSDRDVTAESISNPRRMSEPLSPLEKLSRAEVLFGVIIDLRCPLPNRAASDAFVEHLMNLGCGLVVYTSPAYTDMGLFRPYAFMDTLIADRMRRYPALFIHTPAATGPPEHPPRYHDPPLPIFEPQAELEF